MLEKTEGAVAAAVKGSEQIIVNAASTKNPEKVAESGDTDYLFGCSQEKGIVAKESGEPSVGVEESAMNQFLDDLEDLGKIARFKATEDDKEGDCEIVEASSTGSKRVKKPLPLRIQPVRETGKRKLTVKEEVVPASSAKRPKRSKYGKEILNEMECSEEFLMNEGLTEVFDVLKTQGWEKMCATQEYVCPEVVEDFYRNMKLIGGTVPKLAVNFRGNKFTLSSIELALIMGLEHKGFDHYCKTNVWPKEVAEKKELVKKICKLDSIQKGLGISTQFMEPHVKILHKLLVSNFMQRGVKPSYVQHQDLLILDKLLNKEKINLPKLMIYQMDHLKSLTQIGFSRVIKKVLEEHKLYEVRSDVEEPIVNKFDPEVFRKMNLVKDPENGWIKTLVKEPKIGAKPDLMDVEEEEDDEVQEENAKLMAVFEKVVSDVKAELKEIKAEMREFKKEVTEEIQGMRDELVALCDKL